MKVKGTVRWGLLVPVVLAAVIAAGCGADKTASGLDSRHPLIRRVEVARLGVEGDMSCYDGLVMLLRKDPDRLVRSEAAFALGKLGTRYYSVAFFPLVDSLENDPSVFVRSASALSLSATPDSRSVEPLVHALKDTTRGEMAVHQGDRIIVYRACVADAARTSIERVMGMSFTSSATTPDGQRDEIASRWEEWYLPRQDCFPGTTALASR